MPYSDVPDSELVAQSATVSQVFTPDFHANLMSLMPGPDSFRTNQSTYASTFAGSLTGDAEQARACEIARQAVDRDMTILRGVVKVLGIKDPKVLEALSLGSSSSARGTAASETLSQPTGFKALFTPAGDLVGSVTRMKGAKWFQVWACDGDPTVEANWRLVASSASCRSIPIPGLDRSKNNYLKIRAMGSKGPGPWSHMINIEPK